MPPDVPRANVEKSSNLVNPDTLTYNAAIQFDGTLETNSAYVSTDYIAVDPNTSYSFRHLFRIVWFDSDLTPLYGEDTFGTDVPQITSPATARFARLSIRHSNLGTVQMSVGDTLPPYEPYWVSVDGRVIPLDVPRVNVEKSSNLINLDTLTHGVSVQNDGTLSTTSGYNTTDYISVEPNTTYSLRHGYRIVWFDSDHIRVSYDDVFSSEVYQITSPGSARFARIGFRNSNSATVQMSLGDTLPPYEPYWVSVEGRVISDPSRVNVEKSSNLVNPDTLTYGVAVQPNGTLNTIANYSTTAYIPVDPATSYSLRHCYRIVWFDSDLTRLDSYNVNSSEDFQTTSPATARFARLALRTWHVDTIQMSVGDTLPPYEPYWVSVEGRVIPRMPNPQTNSALEIVPFVLDLDGLAKSYTAPIIEEQTHLRSDTFTPDVFSWYDQLVSEHPDYVTKQDLGPSSTPDYRMYSYTLTPPRTYTVEHGSDEGTGQEHLPVAILVSGTHGYEKASVHHIWRLAKELCDNWDSDPVLETLRWNTQIAIVPLANPFAYDINGRTNANGVDVNRNYEAGWRYASAPGETGYGGESPMTEPENIAIDSVMQQYKDRAVMGADCHNYSATPEYPSSMIWTPSNSPFAVQVGRRHVSRMSRKWKLERDWVTDPTTYYGRVELESESKGVSGGLTSTQFGSYGIPASTFEVSRRQYLDGGDGIDRSSRAMTLGFEATVNYVSMMVYEGAKLKNKLQ